MKSSQNSKNEGSFGDFYDALRRDQERCTIILTNKKHWEQAPGFASVTSVRTRSWSEPVEARGESRTSSLENCTRRWRGD